MTFFPKGIVYIIVPKQSLTEEMINNMKTDFSCDNGTLRETFHTLDSDKNVLLKVKTPISSVFNGYHWYSEDTILEVLNEPSEKWNE